MATIGYFLSSEEHPGSELVRAAVQAERAGFSDVTTVRHPLGRRQVLAVQAHRPANPVPG